MRNRQRKDHKKWPGKMENHAFCYTKNRRIINDMLIKKDGKIDRNLCRLYLVSGLYLCCIRALIFHWLLVVSCPPFKGDKIQPTPTDEDPGSCISFWEKALPLNHVKQVTDADLNCMPAGALKSPRVV